MSLTSSLKFRLSGFRQKLWLLPLAWLWFVLINDLRVEWTVNPQYGYGWAVPFLCALLIWQRIQGDHRPLTTDHRLPNAEAPSSILYLLFALCALLYAPTRLVQEANPDWRLVSWALAIEVVGITLCALRFALGAQRLAQLAFPVCYFLVAVPWPTPVERPLIQGLTRADTNVTAELLGWFGIPGLPHGNVIEVATGEVGIDEACSGIRSFQATLMISMFLGEFYSLGALRRALLVLIGFALSFLFNLARTTLLTWVAARKGVAAIASWHDPAGVTILVACFFCLWGIGVGLKGGWRSATRGEQSAESRARGVEHGTQGAWRFPLSTLRFPLAAVATALGVWIVISELGIEWWYRWHETRVPPVSQWTIAWPINNPTFKELPVTGQTLQILRYDEGRSAGWRDNNWAWQAAYLRWKPGRTAIHLAQNHTPEVCLTATGHALKSISPQEWFEVNGLRMPFLAYQVMDAPQPLFVFYCLWDDRSSVQGFRTLSLTRGNRLASVLAGLRNPGQRSLEIAVAGVANAAEAEAAVREELPKLVEAKP